MVSDGTKSPAGTLIPKVMVISPILAIACTPTRTARGHHVSTRPSRQHEAITSARGHYVSTRPSRQHEATTTSLSCGGSYATRAGLRTDRDNKPHQQRVVVVWVDTAEVAELLDNFGCLLLRPALGEERREQVGRLVSQVRVLQERGGLSMLLIEWQWRQVGHPGRGDAPGSTRRSSRAR